MMLASVAKRSHSPAKRHDSTALAKPLQTGIGLRALGATGQAIADCALGAAAVLSSSGKPRAVRYCGGYCRARQAGSLVACANHNSR